MGVHVFGLGEECVWECVCVVWVRSVYGSACVWFGREVYAAGAWACRCVVWVRSVCGGCVGVHVCGLCEECVWECVCVVWVRSVCGSACVWFG